MGLNAEEVRAIVKIGENEFKTPYVQNFNIVRQRGTKIHPGEHVGIGKDHTIFSLVKGKVHFKTKRLNRTFVSVIPS